MEMQPISREGYEKLREEIRRLEDEEMPKIAAQIAAARAEGDLSENAEYHGQREAQGLMQAKINQLKSKLANCFIADKAQMPKGVIGFGSTVTIKDLSDGSLEKYELVGPGERCASTTNRNYEGRQGRGALTHIMSPAMVAAAAVAGHLADVRRLK